MSKFMDYYKADMYRYKGEHQLSLSIFSFSMRIIQTANSSLLRLLFKFPYKIISIIHNLEIPPLTDIGKGLYLGHAYCITINPRTKIGEFCSINKGVTIGQENRGSRKGVPTIGNKVWLGVNSTVVGKIIIGDDVMIAPNSYVNCDVPSHSVAIGNPCVIHHRENATDGYINNVVS